MLNIIGKRIWFFAISGIMVVIALVSLAVFGLKPGIEFTSGTLMTVSFEQQATTDTLKQALAKSGYQNALVQSTASGEFLVRLPELGPDQRTKLQTDLTSNVGTIKGSSFDTVSPLVASETTRNAIIAIAVCSIGILGYLSWAYRKMPNPLHYGVCAVAALMHDLVVVIGIFSICGAIFGWEIDLMFVTGILSVLGFSDNNTVVIFDRIRENSLKGMGGGFANVVNNSVIETLGRSLNTNLTVVFTITALLLIVGSNIQNLLVVLLVGVVVGTYDSICVAPALLVTWETKSLR